MHFTQKYFHDRLVTSLLACNSLLVVILMIMLVLKVDLKASIIATRYIPLLGVEAFGRGRPLTMYEYLLFAVFIAVGSLFLSARLYHQHRAYAIFCLSFTTVLLLFSLIVSGALLAL